MASLEEIRAQYPQYSEIDDATLANALYDKFYDGKIEKNHFLTQIGLDPEGNEFTRGVGRGVETTAALIAEGVPGVAKGLLNDTLEAVGYDSIADPTQNLENYQQRVQEAYEKYPTDVGSFRDVESLGDAGAFVAATAGEQIPQLGLSLLGGGIGGFAAKKGVAELAKRGGKELLDSEVQKAVKKGLIGGTLATSGSQNIPESYFNLLEKGEDEASKAIIVGALKTGLDVLPQIKILEKILGNGASDAVTESLMKRIGKQAGKSAIAEGATETGQESLDIIAEQFILENQEMFSPENIDRLVNSGLKGAIGGGVMGGASAPLMGNNQLGEDFDYESLSPKKKQKLDEQFAEEAIGKVVKKKTVEINEVNPLDDSMIVPLYVPDNALGKASELGVSQESVTLLSPQDVDRSSKALEVSMDAATLGQIYTNPDLTVDLTPDLQARKAAIMEDQRIDQNYLIGDGEIVMGAPVNDTTATIRNTEGRLVVNDTQLLEKGTEDTTTPIVPKELPTALKGAKPRYKTSKLEFASDLDKAAYIVSNPKKTAKEQKKYMNWLKDATGMTEPDLILQGTDLRKQIKAIDAKNPGQAEITVPSKIQTAFKRLDLPFFGNVRDDAIVPQVIHNNLKGLDLTPTAIKQNIDVIKQAQRVVREVAGKSVTLAPFESLTDLQNNPIAGAQFLNVIAVGIQHRTQTQITETIYHEAYHSLEQSGAFSDAELAVIDSKTETLMSYVDADEYLRGQDYQVLLSSAEGRQEIRANAFGKWAVEQQQKKKGTGLNGRLRTFFKKMLNLIEKMGNAMQGLGFSTLDDIFTSSMEGKRAVDIMDDINYDLRLARYQRIGEEFQDLHQEELHSDEVFEDLMKEKVQAQNETWDTGKHMGWYGRYIRSMHDATHQFPALAPIYAAFDRRNKNSSALMTKYVDILGDFTGQNKGLRHRLHDLGSYMRKTGQKMKIAPDGQSMTFERDEKIVRISDPNTVKQYVQLQNSYKEVLKDRFDQLKEEAFAEFGEKYLNKPDFTIRDIENSLTSLEEGKTKERLENLLETLKGYERMKNTDYVPAMRFGKFGITVRDKNKDEQVAFFTVEGGSLGKQYNDFQMTEMMKDINDQYSDTSRFEVIGDKGVIKNFSDVKNFVPFLLTKNTLTNKLLVDPRFLNFEMLGSILNQKDMDEKAYGEVKQQIYNDLLTRGFKNHFSESEFLGGYSTDWNRVQHAYLSSGAHHLSGVPFQKEMSVLEAEVEKIKDVRVKARARSFIDYNNSPQEDLIALRTFNFMWTMGGNLSTAALQVFTLPTTSLAGMAMLSPNPIKNSVMLGKWFGMGIKDFIPKELLADQDAAGIVHLSFDNKAVLDKLVAKGKMSPAMARTVTRLYKEGKLRGLLTEESIGSRQFETRSVTGNLRGKARTVGNLLGYPITIMEQLTRFATTMAMYELLETNPKAVKKARDIYGKNPLFQARLALEPNKSFIDHVAEMQMDEAHAVFGKLGRPEFMRSYGGALFFPFMTYPQQAIEFMVRMMGRGPDGRRGTYTALTALFLLSGLMGLPGAELLKELLEKLENQVTGSEEDFDLLIRQKIFEATGDAKFAKFVTQGLLRGYADLDVSKRIGLPIPGQDLLLNVLGIRGDTSGVLGVSGSMITAMGTAWNEYNNDAGATKVLSAMLPVAPANYLKALNMSQEGVSTRRGVQLVTPEEITARSIAARAFGVTTDQIATKREELYYSQLLGKTHAVAVERFRNRAKNKATAMMRAKNKQDFAKAKALQQEFKEVIMEYRDYAIKNDFDPSIKAFVKSVNNATKQRLDTRIKPKDVRKNARKHLGHLQDVLGVPE